MNSDDLEKLFSTVDTDSSNSVRARAKLAALKAYDEALPVNSTIQASTAEQEEIAADNQGIKTAARPTLIERLMSRRNAMNSTTQRLAYGGLASAAVLVLTVSIGTNLYNDAENTAYDFGANTNNQDSMLKPTAPSFKSPVTTQNSATDNSLTNQNVEEIVIEATVLEAIPELEPVAQPDYRFEGAIAANKSRAKPSSIEKKYAYEYEYEYDSGFAPSVERIENMAAPSIIPPTEKNSDINIKQNPYQGQDKFQHKQSNPVKLTREQPVSTFSIDVDTTSYSFVRKQLNQGFLPQKDAVRLEEMVNYFPYDYPEPDSKNQPFEATVSVVDSPWNANTKLIHIGIRGYDLPRESTPESNLVFLLDVSGSMNAVDKLPLVKQSMSLLLEQLKPTDTVAIVVYAGAAGTVLEPTQVKHKEKILGALKQLNAGGSTAGGAGLKAAYQLARSSFKEGAVNRVILATDGVFNVGISNREELKGFVERQRKDGIFLTVLGFGQGNYNDHLMQQLAQNGNGVAAYLDTLSEAQKVLVDEATSTLFPIAKDVKLQMEFNPETVQEYRLLGYETRALKRDDFNNDKVDAGDIGAGHRVTAIYEITPVGSTGSLIEPSRYQNTSDNATSHSNEYGFLKLRYKLPDENNSKLISVAANIANEKQRTSGDSSTLNQEINFSLAVAGFAQLLKGGQYTGEWQYADVIKHAKANKGNDEYGYRAEFIQLIRKAIIAESMK